MIKRIKRIPGFIRDVIISYKINKRFKKLISERNLKIMSKNRYSLKERFLYGINLVSTVYFLFDRSTGDNGSFVLALRIYGDGTRKYEITSVDDYFSLFEFNNLEDAAVFVNKNKWDKDLRGYI